MSYHRTTSSTSPTDHFPSQAELLFPLLDELKDAGGKTTTTDVYERLADRAGLVPEIRNARVPVAKGTKTVNAWDRHVRWVQQRARLLDFVHAPEHGVWELTGTGEESLRNTRPGVIVVVYETEAGVAVWADAQTAAGVIYDDTVDLIVTSPPYPVLRKKPYENQLEEKKHIEWLLTICEMWKPKLADSGSLVLNVGDTWIRGMPAQSAWVERLVIRMLDDLGFFRAQTVYWNNTAAMPAPAEWVTVRRQRIKPEIEHCLWFIKDPHLAKADNSRVLVPYSESMQKTLSAGGEKTQTRPSGHDRVDGAFGKDNGGAIPGNVIRAANTDSNSRYLRLCREHGLPIHPARFPAAIPEHFIKKCTDPGDLVIDFFDGSGTTQKVSERLGRRWFACDLSLTYLLGSGLNMNDMPGFQSHVEGVRGMPSLLPSQTNLF